MKYKQIKAMSKEEICTKLLDLRKELIKLNIQVSSGTALKNPGLVRKTKKSIARLTHKMGMKEV